MITTAPPRIVKPSSTSSLTDEKLTGNKALSFSELRVFTVLWAIASLFHMAHSNVFTIQLNFALLTIAAVYAIFRPALASLTVLICLQIFDAFFRMPNTTNHWVFTAFVNITILYAIVFQIKRSDSLLINEKKLFDTFAPVVRIELIILYFYAVFHKLNAGFFSTDTSCATELLLAQNVDSVVTLSRDVITLNAYFTIFIEALIPILLCFRKTALLGILVGVLFHCVLAYSSYNAFYDFSSMVFATYFLFASTVLSTSFEKIKTQVRSAYQNFVSNYTISKLILLSIIGLIAFGALYVFNNQLKEFKSVHLYFFWTAYSLFVVYCVINAMRKPVIVSIKNEFTLIHWSFIVFPVIVFLNGLSPYIGLKTENSYAMFSNLRTEGGKSNHYIIPASFQIFNYQKEVVEIVSSSDPYFQKIASENKQMVYFEFKTQIQQRKPKDVEYIHHGERKRFIAGDRSTAVPANPYILYKLMKFRTFVNGDAQPCSH